MPQERLCGLPVPTMPMRSLSAGLAGFGSSARSRSAYQAGMPAALMAARDRCMKPRRERLPRGCMAVRGLERLVGELARLSYQDASRNGSLEAAVGRVRLRI